jgi:YebC/PmpR family DNA-binding regulatory protein
MAGHSKWKNIKHKKAAADKVKMKQFTKLSKEITTAAKTDPSPDSNPLLRALIEKANRINMPKENYMRAIKKASGEGKVIYESSFYQGYGPENVAVIVEVLSDNKNRAIAEVRHAFTHNGGRIAEQGSVEWMFKKAGIIEGESLYYDEEGLLELILDFAILSLTYDEEEKSFHLAVEVADFTSCRALLEEKKCLIHEAHLGYTPHEKIELSELAEEKVAEFVSLLEDVEDIQHVYLNA